MSEIASIGKRPEETARDRIRRLGFAVTWTRPSIAQDVFDEVGLWAARNAARGVTGLLVPTRDGALQVIEGQDKEVIGLMTSVAMDPRVGALSVLLREWDVARMAPGEGLAFRPIDAPPGFFLPAQDGIAPRARLDAQSRMAETLTRILTEEPGGVAAIGGPRLTLPAAAVNKRA